MKNILGREIRLYKDNNLDFSLKYEWTQAALVPREHYYSHYDCPFRDIPDESGIYLFTFPQGYYLGQAKHLSDRFRSHFFDFYSPKCKDWHKNFCLNSWGAAQDFIKEQCYYHFMLVDNDKLDLYEHSALAQIVNNNMTDKYYNTTFYKREEKE